MSKRKSKASSEKQVVGLVETDNLTKESANDQAVPADDGPKHEPLPEETIEANLGGRFIVATPEGQQMEVRITGRSARAEGHWEALDQLESLRVISTKETIGLVAARPDDALAEQAGAANMGDINSAVDSDVAAMTDISPPSGQVAVVAPERAGQECSQIGNIDDNLPDESWEIPALASFIACRLRRTGEDAWWIGRALALANRKQINNRSWLKWLKEIGLSKSSAYRYIDLSTSYTLDDIKTQPGVGVCKLLDALRSQDDVDNTDDEDLGDDHPAVDTAEEDAVEAAEDPDGDADDDSDDHVHSETTDEDLGDDDPAVDTPAEDSGGKGAAVEDAVEAPAEDSGAERAAVEDSGENPAENSGGEDADDTANAAKNADVDVDSDVQRPITDSERELCRTYITDIGDLARAEFVLMQLKADASHT